MPLICPVFKKNGSAAQPSHFAYKNRQASVNFYIIQLLLSYVYLLPLCLLFYNHVHNVVRESPITNMTCEIKIIPQKLDTSTFSTEHILFHLNHNFGLACIMKKSVLLIPAFYFKYLDQVLCQVLYI